MADCKFESGSSGFKISLGLARSNSFTFKLLNEIPIWWLHLMFLGLLLRYLYFLLQFLSQSYKNQVPFNAIGTYWFEIVIVAY